MTEDTTIDLPFTVTDDITTPDNMIYVATCSDPTLIPNANFSFTGTGQNRVLHIKGGLHQTGSGDVTVTVTDEDGASIFFQISQSRSILPALRH